MATKEKSPEQMIQSCVVSIEIEIEHWKHIKENGCNDPSWADGTNMNLTRNHILWYRRQIAEICKENSIELPDIIGVPVPPEVNNGYMADLKCDRAQRLRQFRDNLVHSKIDYRDDQLVLF